MPLPGAFRGQLGEQRQRALGLFGVEPRQRVADVQDHVVADLHAVDERQRDLLADAVEVDERRRVAAQFDHPHRNGKTHRSGSLVHSADRHPGLAERNAAVVGRCLAGLEHAHAAGGQSRRQAASSTAH